MMDIATQKTAALAALALVVAGNAAGNILLKLGASADASRPLFNIIGWTSASGIACFGLGVLAYAWALKYVDLHTAQIVVSLQYVSVILLAAIVFHEKISLMQWGGIGCIAVGLLLCSR